MSNRKTWNQLILLRVPSYLRGGIIVSAYVGSRVAQRSYGVPSVDYEPTYDNLGRITEMDYGATLVNLDYTYVANENNIDRKTFDHRPEAEHNEYTYDDLDRVYDVDYLVDGSTPDHEETFDMDTLGNRDGDQTLTDGIANFVVDALTNRYESAGGLVAWWKLDETSGSTASDSSGNSHSGALTNFPNDDSQWVTGKYDNALTFDGVDDRVSIGDVDALDFDQNTSFTYSLWVKVDESVGTWDMPFWKGGGSAGNAGYDMELGTSYWQADISDGTSLKIALFGTETSFLGNWTMLTAVVDREDDELRAYADGVQVGSAVDISSLGSLATSNSLTFGSASSGSHPFKGKIDNVMILNEALTAEQVYALYAAQKGTQIEHDAAGNMTVDKDGYKYDYDYENRIVKIEKPDGSGGFDDVAEMDYDALGRRIRVIDKSANPDVTTLYYYSPQWQVLAEYDGSNNLQRYFVYGNYIDEPLVRNNGTSDLYYAHDHLYSVVALINGSGQREEAYEYDAYGTVTVYRDYGDDEEWFTADDTIGTTSGRGNPYTFTGRRLDAFDLDGQSVPQLLMMHYRQRTYDTYTGRFLQHDPLGYIDGLDLYEYVKSNPVLLTDALGGCSKGPPEKPRSGEEAPNVDNVLSCYCFCVDDVWIDLEQVPAKSGAHEQHRGRYGATLTGHVEGHWEKWPDGEMRPGKASVEWWEWFTHYPYQNRHLYRNLKRRQWGVVEWSYPIAYPQETYVFTDKPGASPGLSGGGGGLLENEFEQRVAFMFGAKGHNDCPCELQPNIMLAGAWLIYKAETIRSGYSMIEWIDSGLSDPWTLPPDFPSN